MRISEHHFEETTCFVDRWDGKGFTSCHFTGPEAGQLAACFATMVEDKVKMTRFHPMADGSFVVSLWGTRKTTFSAVDLALKQLPGRTL